MEPETSNSAAGAKQTAFLVYRGKRKVITYPSGAKLYMVLVPEIGNGELAMKERILVGAN